MQVVAVVTRLTYSFSHRQRVRLDSTVWIVDLHTWEKNSVLRELQGERGAVNCCSALTRVSEQLWTCTTERKSPGMTPIWAFTPTHPHSRELRGLGSISRATSNEKPSKEERGNLCPFFPSLLSQIRALQLKGCVLISNAKEWQLHPAQKHGMCNLETLNPVQFMWIHTRKSPYPIIHPTVNAPFTLLHALDVRPGWMFKTIIASFGKCSQWCTGCSSLPTPVLLQTSSRLLSMLSASEPPTTNSHLSLEIFCLLRSKRQASSFLHQYVCICAFLVLAFLDFPQSSRL